ncbi:MAG: hypothetical protein QOI20_1138 [Acidimicrobiaceae bacterium]|jgi:hypothetical protein|nr:hypothetical protein [Acidimicrobiaceae bacterium]
MRGSARHLWAAVAALCIALPGTAQAGQTPRSLPNLAAVTPFYVEAGPPNPSENPLLPPPDPSKRVLKFTTEVANLGSVPLDVLGVPSKDEPTGLDAEQCVGWAAPGVCSARTRVGTLHFHDAHVHWHFDGFALHELRRVGSDGAPDMSTAGLVGSTGKTSFCLMDSERVGGGDDPVGTAPTYQSCTGVRQGITPQWADVYEAGLPGQEIPIDGVPDGVYALVITANPAGFLLETDTTDNAAWALVALSEHGNRAQLVDHA